MAMRMYSGLELAYPNATGIDIGSASRSIAVVQDRDDGLVLEFKSFTVGMEAAADWLGRWEIATVVMESTGVYWIPVCELIEVRGTTVYQVNVRDFNNILGRKSDLLNCQWLQQLMSYGLRSEAFHPVDEDLLLCAVFRQCGMLTGLQARHHVHYMQKALTQMNVQLTSANSDIVDETGQKILCAIITGERDGHMLAKLKNVWIRAGEEEIAKSSWGNWREENLFDFKQAMVLYDFHATQLAECDTLLEHVLVRSKNAPCFDVCTYLLRLCGADLTRINGINPTTVLKVIAEVDSDLSRFKTVKYFASWLELCSGTKISGGRVLSGATKCCVNWTAQALRLVAAVLHKSQSALVGAYSWCMAARIGCAKAITATAHKLVRLIYTMLTKGTDYADEEQDCYEERYRHNKGLHHFAKRAEKLDFEFVYFSLVA